LITDHSKSQRVAHGLDENRLLEEIKEIQLINKMLGLDFVKKGIEVDILLDGSLDLSDEVLSQLDWVVASVHSHFNRDNTDRIIKAMENPFVNVIGHPTGRLIGMREAYPVDMDAVIKTAKETQTALEVNAQPTRMDSTQYRTFCFYGGWRFHCQKGMGNKKRYSQYKKLGRYKKIC